MGDVNVADLDLISLPPQSLEGRVRILEGQMIGVRSFQNRIDADFYNHGSDGLYTRFTKFIARHEERQISREKAERRFRWIVGIGVTFGTVILGTILKWGLDQIVPAAKMIIDDYYKTHPHARLEQPHKSYLDAPVYAESQIHTQTATGD